MEEGPLFAGWTGNAVIVSILGSAGGLLVALTMKYTDAILKTFATSGAIIVTAIAGNVLLNAPLDIPIGVGASCTVLSLLNYSDDGNSAVAAANTVAATPAKPAVSVTAGTRKDALPKGYRNEDDREAGAALIDRHGTRAHSEA